MAFPLLWIEVLATSLLLLATLVACIGRLRRRRLRIGLATLVMLVPLAAYTGLTILAGYLQYGCFLLGTRFYPLLVLTVSFLVGGLWILRQGLRPRGDEPGGPAATSWPRGRLAIGLGVAAALAMMTFWNLDLAARQRMETLRLEAGTLALSIAPPRVPDRDNAALIYQQAFDAMNSGDAWEDVQNEDWGGWLIHGKISLQEAAPDFDPQDGALREFLSRQSAVQVLLSQATDKPGCWFDRDYGRPSFDMVLSELPSFQKGTRLLTLDARCKAAEGDMTAALKDVQTMFVMAEHVAGDPILVSLMVSINMERLADDALQAVLASADVSEEELAILHVNPNASYARHFQRCLRMEQAFTMSTLCQIALEQEDIGLIIEGKDVVQSLASIYRVFVLSEDLAGLRRTMNKAQHLATRPYGEVQVAWEQLAKETKLNGGLFAQLLIPALENVARHIARGDAQHRVVLSAIAMHRYRAANGSFPESLEDLTPTRITVVPRDPFDGKPLKLKRTDGRLVVYSVGPDMVDNGGSPMDKEGDIGDIAFELVEP